MTYASTSQSLGQWHRTLGHMNYDDIMRLQSVTESMVVTQTKQDHTCTTCMENKITRTSKPLDEKPSRANKPLQSVHTDICGPIKPCSREGYRYVINFVDKYSSMIFTYFLHSKDEAHEALKNFLADVAPFTRPKEIIIIIIIIIRFVKRQNVKRLPWR